MSSSGAAGVASILEARRADSDRRLCDLKGKLAAAEKICAKRACVYATGSMARGEASAHSDLDLFIVGKGKIGKSKLSHLNEIRIQSELIAATSALGFPQFSGDGAYLKHYSVGELVSSLGTRQDDASNTFTARLLLLLESRPLLGVSVYESVIQDVIAQYWRDFRGHEHEFMPAFLANDILRMWRTFCVNYEARTERDPPLKKAKGKLKKFKLSHSRLLTCYSALLYLLGVYSIAGTVTQADALSMVGLTPTQRLEWILRRSEYRPAHDAARRALRLYERFLTNTDPAEAELVQKFQNPSQAKAFAQQSTEFGDSIFEVLELMRKGHRHKDFYRFLVV
ncbi:MAG TPA: nucleotidyltransferase domain-containing protein [Terriglobales bacterium]|nr:nucleotidyltransferase domain-containing protein [Terriglobales bacterium]